MKKIIFFFLFFSFLTNSLFAQAPNSFNYQGATRDKNGSPLQNRNISIRFTILKDNPFGVMVYQEIQSTKTNQLGLFNLIIGTNSFAQIGSIKNIDWGNGAYFLRVELDETGGNKFTTLGTTQFQSVPYALYAAKAGNSTTTIVDSSKWKNTSLNIPSAPRSGILYEKYNSNFSLLSGQNTQLLYPYFSQFTMTEKYTDTKYGNSSSASLTFIRGHYNNDEPLLEFAYPAEEGTLRNFSFRTAGLSRLFIKGNGNIGIGTTTPQSKLQISDGDVYIENPNQGIILKSPNGKCFRVTIDDNGNFVRNAIPCPN